jgi:predicted transcriptional regulator
MPETTDMDPQKVDPHLTARIVRSYFQHHAVGTGQVSDLIASVHGALAQLGRSNQPDEVLIPAVSVRRSVHRDYAVCLDCGYRGKTLSRHISKQHGLRREEYLKRWGLRRDHLLTAPADSEQRSTMAKALGLGRKPMAEVAPAATSSAPASADDDGGSEAKLTRRRSARSASKSANGADGAAPPPAKKRSRSRVAPERKTPRR